ncbi:unnamed protein product (macronuclear) [Paramecium tetraurelia]|uniref:Uncharacterized protein n=1 Tax=Paramecium tetraurelia TaxID=5888 RepID=A0DB06_PARTE|nr:uncharacterized protein GSPATT00039380001 [Paramecium tetraurelia]CAK80223.1 unnamed protein product [Paramecium tetraurelia]|eukprot:XP_001447620.1 hypothetical protein (macronuclear) [Paramecium tetraurelia strain d4-2]
MMQHQSLRFLKFNQFKSIISDQYKLNERIKVAYIDSLNFFHNFIIFYQPHQFKSFTKQFIIDKNHILFFLTSNQLIDINHYKLR